MPEFTIRFCIRRYHVYGMIWTILDKQLLCECEIGKVADGYAVAAKTFMVYFCFLLDKSEYGNKASHSYAIYHIVGLCHKL